VVLSPYGAEESKLMIDPWSILAQASGRVSALTMALGLAITIPATAALFEEHPDDWLGGEKSLVYTLMRDDREDLLHARKEVERAERELEEAIDEVLPDDEIKEREERLNIARDELDETKDLFKVELEAVREGVSELSPEQRFALVRSLRNTESNGLRPDIDSDEVDEIISGDYGKRQINALTKAYEEEDKFLRKAEQAERLFDETGDPALLDQYERFVAKADSQREKFLAKVARWNRDDVEIQPIPSKGLRSATRGAQRDATNGAARRAARDATNGAARRAARDAARGAARRAATEASRGAAKRAAKQVALRAARDEAKLSAKQAARKGAQQAAKSATRKAARRELRGKQRK
jgi:hypothetical protein